MTYLINTSASDVVTCGIALCDWQTGVPNETGAAIAAVCQLGGHFIEDHEYGLLEATSLAARLVRRAVPE